MTLGARFTKWGLGLFIFGVFLVFGIIGHYCSGARYPTGQVFLQNITLWYACPWTLSVASVQAGGLGMVALGLAHIAASRAVASRAAGHDTSNASSLWLCVVGLLGVFAVGYPGYLFSTPSGRVSITRRLAPEKTRGSSAKQLSSASTLSAPC